MTNVTSKGWTTLSSKTVFNNNWITLTDHKVKTPTGTNGTYGVVRFKNRAVGVVPYENGHVWLVGQSRYALDSYSWEIPEGGCPSDENLEDCAHRELMEETGLSAKSLTPLLQMHLSNSVTDEWGIVYLARELSHGTANPEATEDISIRKVKLETFYKEVEAGKITDSLSVATCYKLMLMRAMRELD